MIVIFFTLDLITCNAVFFVKTRSATVHIYGPGPEVEKLFFMLNLAEHEILDAHKCKNNNKIRFFQAQISLNCYFPAYTYVC